MRVYFTGQTGEIAFEFDQSPVQAVAIADCNAPSLNVKIQLNNTILFELNTMPIEAGIKTIILPRTLGANSVIFAFSNMVNGMCGKLYVGGLLELPRIGRNSGKYDLNITSQSQRTSNGQVYGVLKPSYGGFSADFPKINEEDRVNIEKYIDTVQKATPHFIEPYEDKPMYVVVDSYGGAQRINIDGFYYSTSIGWEEAL
jgi:hypothetical protein